MNAKFQVSEDWVKTKISILQSKKILDPLALRMVHYENAKRQIIYIYKTDLINRDFYKKFLQDEVNDISNPIIGLVWLLNSTRKSNLYTDLIQLFNSECINDRLIFSLESEDEIINSHALFLLEILYSRTKLELKDISEIIVKLIHNVNNITTYALSSLLNSVFNEKDSKLVRTINFECLKEQFNKLDLNYLYSWSKIK
ncbi:hypothetical protein [Lysinibacillus fusiformis]|uniref:hypothetical protein n=1 Tax=Lysinibacillus fusiformis TaxID=28031 RepID=UPI002E245E3D|nr:hypothetical protein [Lysinibacillus fusiformis]